MTTVDMTVIWFAVFLLATAFFAYLFMRNKQTFEQRKHIIHEVVFNRPDWEKRLKMYDSVPYNAHMNALIFFRDPMKLYNFPKD